MTVTTYQLESIDSALLELVEHLLMEAPPKKERPGGIGAKVLRTPMRSYLHQLTTGVRKNYRRMANWMRRAARSPGGAPIKGPIRMRAIFGIPIRPSIMKTKEGRAFVKALDKKWAEVGQKEPFNPLNPGRLNLADELDVMARALKIRRRSTETDIDLANRIKPKLIRVFGREAIVSALLGLIVGAGTGIYFWPEILDVASGITLASLIPAGIGVGATVGTVAGVKALRSGGEE